jgi:hypothetical protein
MPRRRARLRRRPATRHPGPWPPRIPTCRGCPIKCARKSDALVAQSGTLLYRRLVVGRAPRPRRPLRPPRPLPLPRPAGCQPAIQQTASLRYVPKSSPSGTAAACRPTPSSTLTVPSRTPTAGTTWQPWQAKAPAAPHSEPPRSETRPPLRPFRPLIRAQPELRTAATSTRKSSPASALSSCLMRRSWLCFAVRSERLRELVLIWPRFVPPRWP